jgi:hypothetical protein
LIEKVDTSREAVRKTGKAFLIAGCVVAAILFWKHGFDGIGWRWVLGAGIALYGAGIFAYPVMKPIHIGWMKLAQILGWISTRIVLGLFFYLVLTPGGLVIRLLGKDLLDRRIDKSAKTYWRKRESTAFDPKRMENQF